MSIQFPRRRWTICFLLYLITVSSYMNRQVFSLVAPVVAKELSFNNSDIALVINAFIAAYTFGQLLAGAFVDTIGIRKAFTIAAVLWSATTIFTGLARGLWSFVGLRFFWASQKQ